MVTSQEHPLLASAKRSLRLTNGARSFPRGCPLPRRHSAQQPPLSLSFPPPRGALLQTHPKAAAERSAPSRHTQPAALPPAPHSGAPRDGARASHPPQVPSICPQARAQGLSQRLPLVLLRAPHLIQALPSACAASPPPPSAPPAFPTPSLPRARALAAVAAAGRARAGARRHPGLVFSSPA